MYKKILLVLLPCFLVKVSAALSQSDPTVMTVGGRAVGLQEFKYCYDRDCHSAESYGDITVKEYLPYFINYKLAETEAYTLRLDTVSSLQADYADVRQKTVALALVTDSETEAEAQRVYSETKANVGQRGLLRLAHILLYVRQDASNTAFESARCRADSLYTAIKSGADFAQLAKQYSQDEASASGGGVLPWIQPNQTWEEFERAAYALQVGEVSRPVQSPIGFHIIKLIEKKQLEPYDSLRGTIIKMLIDRGIRAQIISGKVDNAVKASNGKLERAEALDKIKTDIEQNDPEVRAQLAVYRSEMLGYAAYQRYLENKKPYPTATLKAWFERNKKRYYWDEPHFKGIVIHAKTQQDLLKAKSAIKDVPYALWTDMIEKQFNSGAEKRVKCDKVLCAKGENQYVDQAWSRGTVAENVGDEFPYVDVCGTTLKKKAVSYEDVSPWVQDDYEEELRQQWLNTLKSKYTVKVYDDVLKTVNQDNK